MPGFIAYVLMGINGIHVRFTERFPGRSLVIQQRRKSVVADMENDIQHKTIVDTMLCVSKSKNRETKNYAIPVDEIKQMAKNIFDNRGYVSGNQGKRYS